MGVHDHKAGAPRRAGCVVITCSDTRSPETDTSGALMSRLLREHGHDVVAAHLIKDEPNLILEAVRVAAQQDAVQVILINGGTGISRRDSTFEAIDRLLEKRLDGFGELFRALSYQEIGSSAMMTRATAGIYQGRVVFSTPGSESAVRLAMEKLILPELGHLLKELAK